MTTVDIGLLSVAVAAISALATSMVLPRGVGRQELMELLDKHMQACRLIGQVRDRADEVRNGRIERLENMAATKADLACLRQDLIDRIDKLERRIIHGGENSSH